MRDPLLLGVTLGALLSGGCSPAASGPGGRTESAAGIFFVDRSQDVGLDFVHRGGMSGERYFVEIMGAGGALVDFDNDGDLDVFLPQGHSLPRRDPSDGAADPGDRLFRNDLTASSEGERRLKLVDVTEASGIRGDGYGLGVAAGDVDNDGWIDLYVTNFGPNQLWRNRGASSEGVTFEEIAEEAGIEAPGWSSSATFFDFDRDGWLDLYVVSYVDYEIEGDVKCRVATGLPDYCSPLTYSPRRDRLYRNLGPTEGKGRVSFEDVSNRSGISEGPERGLGVVSGDFNADGWPDLYVANDMTPNFLWVNRSPTHEGPGRRFVNEALLAGCAVNRQGKPEASMGVAAGDIDGDGDEDLFMTHLDLETNTLFRNDGEGLFDDTTALAGLGGKSLESTGFGAAIFDFDNDGNLDLLAVNGAVTTIEAQALAGEALPLRQPNQLFRNLGVGTGNAITFSEVSGEAGEAFSELEVSRGAAVGDIDNDGDLDILVTNNHGPARLLENTVGDQKSWLGLRLVDRQGGRDMLGAVARLTLADGRVAMRRVRTDGSYCSANDPRVLFGLGELEDVTRIEVDWPDGTREVWRPDGLRRYVTLVRGEGERVGLASG